MDDESEYGFVAIANELLQRFRLPVITSLSECTSHIFVALYEGILGEKHLHIVSVRNKRDELTNVQAIIDTLAQDVLHADLSHISGQAIIDGDHVTIRYLLEIFIGLMEYVMEQITSGASTDAEDDVHDPDILTQGTISTISDILQEDLGTRDHSYRTRSRNSAGKQQRLKQSDISLPSTISNVDSHYDSEYTSDSTIDMPQHVLARKTVTIPPQDVVRDSERHALARNTVTSLPQGPTRTSQGLYHGTVTISQKDGARPLESGLLHNTVTIQDSGRPSEQHRMLSQAKELHSEGLLTRTTGETSSATWQPSRTTGQPLTATGQPLRASGQPLSTARSPSKTARVPSLGPTTRAMGQHPRPAWTTSEPVESVSLSVGSEESEGEKIKKRVLENESIEKLKDIKKQGYIDAVVDSSQELSRGSADNEQKSQSNDSLQVEEVSSSLTTISPPSATKHRPAPSGRPEENAFISLGVRPKPASHPHFQQEHKDGIVGTRSSGEDVGVRHHLHTHHHYHMSDDRYNQPLKKTTTRTRSQKAAHTLTHPPSDDADERQVVSTARLPSVLQLTSMDKARDSRFDRPTDADYRLARPTDADYRLARPTDADYRLARPTDADYRLARSADADYRLARSADADYKLARSADADPLISQPRDRDFMAAGPGDTELLMSRPTDRDFMVTRPQDPDTEITRPRDIESKTTRPRNTDFGITRLSDTGRRPGINGSRLGQSLPPSEHPVVTKDKPVGYNLRSHQDYESKSERTTRAPQRKVAFALEDQDELIDESDEFELDKDYILEQLKKRLIDKRYQDRMKSSEDTDSDISQHSDSVVDYDSTPQAKRYRVYSPKREYKPKSSVVKPVLKKNHVHFDDALKVEGKGQFAKIRRSVRKEGAGHLKKTKAMKEVYANHLQQLETGQKELMNKKKKAAELLDKKYRKIHQIPKMKRYSAANKYTKSSVAGNQERRKVKGQVGKRKRSASSSPILVRNRRPLVIEEDEMLPTVMSEFPMLHVSPHTAHNMWSKQMRQLEQLTKSGFNQSRKTKTQQKMEEAERRQELLLRIMRKELAHNRRMKDIKEKRENEKAMKAKIQEQRQATARARRYYEQFEVRSSARMLKRKNREEQIFKKLFEEGLQIQKNRVRELRKYAKEKREEMAIQQQNEIESLENYYSNQFAMLAEAIGQERHDLLVRDNAQAKVMATMKRELRRKMETEIQEFQENLYNDEDREYFRQVEADRMKRDLQLAAYKASL